MANYFSSAVGSQGQVSAVAQNQGHLVTTFSITFAGITFVNGDLVYLAQIPLLATVTDFYLVASATLGSTITWSIGDTTTAAKYASASTFGQGAANGGTYANGLNGFVASSLPVVYNTQTSASLPFPMPPSVDVADLLVMKASAAGGASTTATVKGFIRYTLGPQY